VIETEIELINEQASTLMKRGIALMEEARREAAIDALHCFDEALTLRRQVPAGHSPLQGYLLAACLLNRADALVRLNDAAPLAAALASYDEAIAVLRTLPMEDDPLYPRRLAIGCQNRGLALQVRGREEDAEAAAAAFTDAIAVLEDAHSAGIPDRDYLRAVVWLNLANLRATGTSQEARVEGRDAAGRALAYVRIAESEHMEAAAIGLQARHVLCRLCAHSLSEASEDDGMPEDVHEATDAVDEGLALVRLWEQGGIEIFRPFAFDLFRFGSRVYARFQPQFLKEFIAENLDPALSSPGYVESPEMQLAADEALQLGARGSGLGTRGAGNQG
jgi:tetratricopeptide (TPR) repeat protein